MSQVKNRSQFTRTPSSLAVSVALFGVLSMPTFAEEAENTQSKDTLEVITVTATKNATNLMKTPVAITAMNPEALLRQNIKEVSDLSGLIPNFQLGLSSSDSGVRASIRGVTSNNFTEIGDPAVGIHIDGIYSPRPQGALALMFDLEQVEVLRGAQGTLFGRNSTAGVVNIIPAKPDFDESFGWSTLQLGNYNAKQLRSVYNFAIADNFAIRAAYMVDKRDGYINQKQDLTDRGQKLPDPNGEWGDSIWEGPDGISDVDQRRNKKVGKEDYYSNSDQWGARITGRWQVNNDLEWILGYEHFQNDGAGHVNLKDCQAAKDTRYACDSDDHFDQTVLINVPGKMDMSIDTIRSIVSWDINENTVLEYRFAYANQQRQQDHDDDTGFHALVDEVDIMYEWGNWGRQAVDDRATYTVESEYKSYVNELQVTQTFADWRYVAGAFWMYEDNSIKFAQDMLVMAPWGMPYGQYYNQPKREIDSKAIFAQADIMFTDKLTATIGARYTEDERTDTDGETYGNWDASGWYYNGLHEPTEPLGTGLAHNGNDLTDDMGSRAGSSAYPGPTINTYSKDWNKTTWRLGLQYDLDAKNMIFTSVATGYRAGGFGDKFDTCGGGTCVDGSTEQYSFLDYEPETTTNYEVGYKGSLLDQTLNLTAVFFFTKYEDMHYTDMHPVGQKFVEQTCPDWDQACDIVQAWKTENIGNADIMGLEVEFDYIPWVNGHLTGFYAWLDTEITSYDSYSDNWFCGYREENGAEECADLFIEPGNDLSGRQLYDVTGNQLPHSPEHSFGLNYSHYFEFDNGFQVVPWIGFRWQEKMYFTPRNLDNKVVGDYQEDYINVNASLKFSPIDEDWYIELYGTNMTDEVIKNWMGQGSQGGFQFNSYNAPTMYGVRFNVTY